jgi:hypothetical protein
MVKHNSQEMILYLFCIKSTCYNFCDLDIIGKNFFYVLNIKKAWFKTGYFLFYFAQRRE